MKSLTIVVLSLVAASAAFAANTGTERGAPTPASVVLTQQANQGPALRWIEQLTGTAAQPQQVAAGLFTCRDTIRTTTNVRCKSA
jgi:hypothetical protein